MSNKKLIDSLKIVLANNYALYLKTQNYHWNVTGPHFRALHILFEEQYNDLFTANDVIAERIRTLGEKVPATFDVFKKASFIKDGDEQKTAQLMVEDLAQDQELFVKVLKEALKEAEKIEDNFTSDLLIGRIGIHEKNAWILRSSCI